MIPGLIMGNTQIPTYLQDISVTIKSENRYSSSEGSGVLVVREVDGEEVTFVLTCAHVVDNLRKVKQKIKGGMTIKKVEFDDVKIVKELVEAGRKVGEVRMDAEVIKYSDADEGEDLAVLMVKAKNYSKSTTKFHLSKEDPIIPIGTELYHVGSLLGQFGANSMTSGIMSQVGRVWNKIEFDQTTVTAFPGSSGGGVYTKDGTYVGMIVRGAGEGFNLIVPMRRIIRWTEEHDIGWLLDPSIDAPTMDEIQELPVENTSELEDEEGSDTRDFKDSDKHKFLIRKLPLVEKQINPIQMELIK